MEYTHFYLPARDEGRSKARFGVIAHQQVAEIGEDEHGLFLDWLRKGATRHDELLQIPQTMENKQPVVIKDHERRLFSLSEVRIVPVYDDAVRVVGTGTEYHLYVGKTDDKPVPLMAQTVRPGIVGIVGENKTCIGFSIAVISEKGDIRLSPTVLASRFAPASFTVTIRSGAADMVVATIDTRTVREATVRSIETRHLSIGDAIFVAAPGSVLPVSSGSQLIATTPHMLALYVAIQ